MIVVVGGTGFIGRHLVEQLHASGREAVVISRSPDREFLGRFMPRISSASIGAPAAFEAIDRATAVIYLAHTSRPADGSYGMEAELRSNVIPAIVVTEQLVRRNPGCRLIYASSGGQVYGGGHEAPILESMPLRPTTVYGLGKKYVEEVLEYYRNTAGLSATVLRLANPVGRWQLSGSHGFVSAAVKAAVQGLELTLFGDGRNQRDYFDVRDLVGLLCAILEQNEGAIGTFNIGSGISMTEVTVIETVERVLGKRIVIKPMPGRPFDLRYGVPDIRLATDQLGWRPSIRLEESIEAIARALDVGR